MRAEDQVDDGVGQLELARDMLLLHHAAADRDDLSRPGFLGMVQSADVAENAHLGMLPHGAGIDDDDVGLKLVPGEAVAHLGEVSADFLAVGLVLLAAVGVNHRQRPLPVGGDALKDFRADFPLGFDLFGFDHFSLNCHG